MKLFAKIFLCGTLVFCMAMLPAGYYLISHSYENAIKRETEYTLTRYQYDKFTVQVRLFTDAAVFDQEKPGQKQFLNNLADELRGQAAFFGENKEPLFSNLPEQVKISWPQDEDTLSYQMQEVDGKGYVVVCGKIVQSGKTLYLATVTDISAVIAGQRQMIAYFRQVYTIALIGSMILLLLFSLFLTRPIKRLTAAAGRIADGNYEERLKISSQDEIGELAERFNQMTETIEDKIHELSENARQKEEFTASFAHELKTPLTSVIGYADMLYQGKLTEAETKEAAWYILNEGMRLESLSLKMMDLVILNRYEFMLTGMPAIEVLEDIVYGLNPVFAEKKIVCSLDAETADIRVEYDLFKTLMLNLIDNAMKAESTAIRISGQQTEAGYLISVADNGRGMQAAELKRVTEAFYTVDKSRSRRQHGVGLGLALAEKIAGIHESRLILKSQPGAGTTVEFVIPCEAAGAGRQGGDDE